MNDLKIALHPSFGKAVAIILIIAFSGVTSPKLFTPARFLYILLFALFLVFLASFILKKLNR